MNNDDFRYMRRGKQLSLLLQEDSVLLKPINLQGEGTDRALLLLHGFSSSPAVYRCFIPEIKHYDALVCPVLKGHAESLTAFSLSTADDWRLTAEEACTTLLKKYKKVDVLGLSLGGLLACELSQKYPINHLFLLVPALKLNMRVPSMLKLAQGLKRLGLTQLKNAAGSLLTNQYAEISYKTLPITAIIEMLSLVYCYQWAAPPCPVDLFLGTYDQVIATKKVAELFASLPHATIHWLKNSAHILPLDNNFKEIIQCINTSK